MLGIQHHGVSGNGLDQLKDDSRWTILWPKAYATGTMVYPYTGAKK